MGTDGKYHTVQQGETTTGLAFGHGLHWQTIWQHPNNLDLRNLRQHQNILHPGDRIFIPAREVKELPKPTDQLHKFVRLGTPEKFNMQFLDYDGQPHAGAPYILTVDGNGLSGNLDGQGWIRIPLPPDAQSGRLLVGEDGKIASLNLRFGCLDPLADTSGIQARLQNLGYFGGAIDGADSDELQAAVRKFRQDQKLSEDGGIDDDLRSALKKIHYS